MVDRTAQMAKDVLELLQYLKWTENIHVIGFELGGMIGLELALQATAHTIQSLTLVSTHSGRSIPPVT